MRLQCVYYGSHTCVVITLLTQEALDRIYVAGDTGLSRIVLLAAVFSNVVSVNKDSGYERRWDEVLSVRLGDQKP